MEELERLKQHNIELQRAFENVDLERVYWRRQTEKVRLLLEQAIACLKPYEGE